MNKTIEHLTKDIKNYYKNHMSLGNTKKEYTDIKKINLKDVNKITSEVYKNISSIKKINGLASEYFIDIKKVNGTSKELFHIKFIIMMSEHNMNLIFTFYKDINDKYYLICQIDKNKK